MAQTYELKVKMLPGEVWYGAHVQYGFVQPLTARSVAKYDTTVVSSYNQATPMWLSNKGRYIWSEGGYHTGFLFGRITCSSAKAEIKLYDGYGTLKGAYLAASKAHFPPDGTMPDEVMFRTPQYCTWIQLDTNQTQERILAYAHGILDAGMPAGELLIDDGWQQDFGEWRFHKDKFSDPKAMMDELRGLGFHVILWICPFVSRKAADYEALKSDNLLVRTAQGDIADRKWWNGSDPLLDFSHPDAVKWFHAQTDFLMEEYGVAGFKQDAGDSMYYKDDDQNYLHCDANEQSYLWAESARDYRFNELRACWKGGGWGVTQRLGDKSHSWKFIGLGALVPNALLQGLSGYPYCCPDMIGGGQIGDFRRLGEDRYDNELLVRYAQCSALMPMMQYSLAVWNLKHRETAALCKQAAVLHETYSERILELARHAAQTGEPIVRYLDYVFPGQGLQKIKDAFMLGDTILVAPVRKKGARTRKIHLPAGEWHYLPTGETYQGGKTVTVPAPLDTLPVFEKSK